MSNIRKAFENGKAFIPFITCGDPDLGTTAAVVRAAAENGADLPHPDLSQDAADYHTLCGLSALLQSYKNNF